VGWWGGSAPHQVCQQQMGLNSDERVGIQSKKQQQQPATKPSRSGHRVQPDSKHVGQPTFLPATTTHDEKNSHPSSMRVVGLFDWSDARDHKYHNGFLKGGQGRRDCSSSSNPSPAPPPLPNPSQMLCVVAMRQAQTRTAMALHTFYSNSCLSLHSKDQLNSKLKPSICLSPLNPNRKHYAAATTAVACCATEEALFALCPLWQSGSPSNVVCDDTKRVKTNNSVCWCCCLIALKPFCVLVDAGACRLIFLMLIHNLVTSCSASK